MNSRTMLECYRQKISVLVFLMGRNPKCLRRVLLPPPSPVLANIPLILTYDVPDTEDVGCTPISGPMLGQYCSPLLIQCRSIVYDADPTLIYHRVCCIPTLRKQCHSTNTVSMLTHSLRRWPVIETALGDCTVFLTAAICW